jgi:hypothetical protein
MNHSAVSYLTPPPARTSPAARHGVGWTLPEIRCPAHVPGDLKRWSGQRHVTRSDPAERREENTNDARGS